MIKTIWVLISVCIIVVPAATPANAQQRPGSILCQGKAVSPIPGSIFSEIALSATVDYDRALQMVLRDTKGNQEFVGRQEVLGVDDLDVYVRTGSLTVQRATGSKVVLKLLWQKAGLREDFIGLVITLGYTSVLQVDSSPYETGKSAQMPFRYFDGESTILYRGTCVAR